MVLLSGEPGIGKSRLTVALLERLASEPHTRLRYFCSPQHTDSALYPIIGQMERAAGLQRDDTSLAKLDKLDALLAQTSTSKEDGALLAEMLSLPNDGRYPAINLIPQQRRQRTLEALTTQLKRLASQHPVLMVFEDVHWTDPTSLEALKRSVDQIKALSALLIVSFRPEFVAPWQGQSQATSIILNRLGGASCCQHRRQPRRKQGIASRRAGGDRGAHRRYSSVRGGDDESGAGSRKRKRRAKGYCSPGSSVYLNTLRNGKARPVRLTIGSIKCQLHCSMKSIYLRGRCCRHSSGAGSTPPPHRTWRVASAAI